MGAKQKRAALTYSPDNLINILDQIFSFLTAYFVSSVESTFEAFLNSFIP